MNFAVKRTLAQLEQLMHLVKTCSLFNDTSAEINRLTSLLKQNITSLQRQIAALKELAVKNAPAKSQLDKHCRQVVEILRSRLADATQQFSLILELRTENIRKLQEEKRHVLGVTKTSRRKRLVDPSVPQSSGSPGASASSSSRMNDPLFDFNDGAGEGSESGETMVMIQQPPVFAQAEMEEYSYSNDRADAIESVERVLVELGNIFTEIASQLHLHAEHVQRINTNIEAAGSNMASGYDELLKFWHGMQESRWLYLKVFGIVIFFIIVFFMLFA